MRSGHSTRPSIAPRQRLYFGCAHSIPITRKPHDSNHRRSNRRTTARCRGNAAGKRREGPVPPGQHRGGSAGRRWSPASLISPTGAAICGRPGTAGPPATSRSRPARSARTDCARATRSTAPSPSTQRHEQRKRQRRRQRFQQRAAGQGDRPADVTAVNGLPPDEARNVATSTTSPPSTRISGSASKTATPPPPRASSTWSPRSARASAASSSPRPRRARPPS